ncbi:MAG: hypothetical protein IJJ70_09615 [Treponema sp.]|nr:hypothetical protein [Treponema sp.]MBR0487940.1 hypothetical protein [Treponema sp.]
MKKTICGFLLGLICLCAGFSENLKFKIQGPERSYNQIQIINQTKYGNFDCNIYLLQNKDGKDIIKENLGFLHLKGRNDTCSNRTSVKKGSLIGISLSNGADDVSYALSYEDFPFFDIVQIYLIDADSGANKMKEVGQEF